MQVNGMERLNTQPPSLFNKRTNLYEPAKLSAPCNDARRCMRRTISQALTSLRFFCTNLGFACLTSP